MYKKITKEDIEKIKVGDIIAWYPNLNISLETINESDKKNLQLLQIAAMSDEYITLEFYKTKEVLDSNNGKMIANLDSVKIIPYQKKTTDIIIQNYYIVPTGI